MKAPQFRYLHGYVLKDFLELMDIEASKENILKTKEIFKAYLQVPSTSALDERTLSIFTEAMVMLIAREFGKEVPIAQGNKSMRQILNETNNGFRRETRGN